MHLHLPVLSRLSTIAQIVQEQRVTPFSLLIPPMSKLHLDMPSQIQDLEAYELQPASDSASSPLLPSYSSSLPRSSSPPLTLGRKPQHAHKKRSGRTCRALLIVWSLVVPALLGGALFGCYTGQGRDWVSGIKDWEAVPQDVKDWLDKVVPGERVGGLERPDPGMFPTKWVLCFLDD